MRNYLQLSAGLDEPIIDPHMPIIDAHHHLFDRPHLRYMLDDYLRDVQAGHRIVGSVYVETLAFARPDGAEILRPLGEIEFANGVAAMAASGVYGDCKVAAGIVGYADLRLGDKIAILLDHAAELAPERFKGVLQVAIDDPREAPYRFMTNAPPRGLLKSSGIRAALKQVENRKLTFDAAVFHHQLPQVMDLADAFPDLTIILNNCGHPMAMDMNDADRSDVFREHHRLLRETARRPNILCKIGGFGLPFWGFGFDTRQDPIGFMELAAAWQPHVETAIEAFGASRCMMESDYPMDGRSAGFVPTWNALKHITRGASAGEKRSLFHDTAARAYRLFDVTAS